MQHARYPRQSRKAPDVFQMLSVYAGQECVGFLFPRGRGAIEAFDANDHSLGIFTSQAAAADVICKAAMADGS